MFVPNSPTCCYCPLPCIWAGSDVLLFAGCCRDRNQNNSWINFFSLVCFYPEPAVRARWQTSIFTQTQQNTSEVFFFSGDWRMWRFRNQYGKCTQKFTTTRANKCVRSNQQCLLPKWSETEVKTKYLTLKLYLITLNHRVWSHVKQGLHVFMYTHTTYTAHSSVFYLIVGGGARPRHQMSPVMETSSVPLHLSLSLSYTHSLSHVDGHQLEATEKVCVL